MSPSIDPRVLADLRAFGRRLIDPAAARTAVAPERPERGYWFGGGNMARGPDGRLFLTGRYRSAGDSRTGLDLGDRGRELAVFASGDGGRSWEKVLSFDKAAVSPDGREALSIEGSALRFSRGRVDLLRLLGKATFLSRPRRGLPETRHRDLDHRALHSPDPGGPHPGAASDRRGQR
ncbi:MAG: hypothetical protein M0C28_23475 [Candidatus Moduliflexus flocculans]|nr:hypothetical protein [Candidatus Moduliflexus flocculans]